MRRTTISHSKGRAAWIAAALVAAATPLSAQDTTAVAQDTTAVAAQDTAAVAPQGQRIHVVRGGETLWTLAGQYFGDPLLWPQIYRLNTLVVEDPHWIFPGEELRLVPPDTVRINPNQQLPVGDSILIPSDSLDLPVTGDTELENQVTEAPPPPPPPPPSGLRPTVFSKRGESRRRGLTVVRTPPRRPTGRLRFYAAGFLTEGESFPWADVLGAVDQNILRTLRATSSATVYEQVSIKAPNNATYQVGDSLVLHRLSRAVSGWGRIVVPTGIARVVAVDGRDVRAEIEMQWERVADGQVALPVEPFRDRTGAEAVPIENGMRGTVISIRDLHPVAGMYDVIFVDRGRADGIVPGDVFEVIEEQEGEFPARQVAVLEVAHVREHSAAAFIDHLEGVGVQPGAVVRLIRKMS